MANQTRTKRGAKAGRPRLGERRSKVLSVRMPEEEAELLETLVAKRGDAATLAQCIREALLQWAAANSNTNTKRKKVAR